MKLRKQDAAGEIESFLLGNGGTWDWDDFISVSVKGDAEVNAIRIWCALLPEIYPPDRPGKYCSEEGMQVLRRIAEYLRRES